jgi:hypothetical protein
MNPKARDAALARDLEEYRGLLRRCAKLAGVQNVELRRDADDQLYFTGLGPLERKRLLADLRAYLDAAGAAASSDDDDRG